MTTNENNHESGLGYLSGPILVPLDGTDVAEGILPWVSGIAKKANAPLILLTVVDPDGIEYPSGLSLPSESSRGGNLTIYRDQIEESARVHALESLNATVIRLRDDGVSAEAEATLGNPAERILRVSEEAGCGLIAMSTHGRNPIGRSILGSVTDKVLHSSSVPVLTVAPERAKMYHEEGETLATVVAPLDGSELAERALPYVEDLARALSLEVLLVRVVRIEHPSYYYTEYATRLPDFTEDMAAEAERYLKGVSRTLRDKGLTVQHRVLRGAAAPSLLNLAHKTPRNLIAMTTHGRSGLTRWMMGSVAEALIRGSGDPVLVVRSQ